MSECRERIPDLVRIQAFKKGVLDYSSPEPIKRPYVTRSFIEGDATGGVLPLTVGTASVKDDTDTDVAGTYRKVTLSWEVESFLLAEKALLDALLDEEHEFLLTQKEGNQMLVRTADNGYEFNLSVADGTLTADCVIYNTSGLQEIID